MRRFIDTFACRSHAHCKFCRSNEAWRIQQAQLYIMPKRCWRRILGLGDVVAGFLKLPGIAWIVRRTTGINPYKPCGGCKKRQKWLNEKVPLRKP